MEVLVHGTTSEALITHVNTQVAHAIAAMEPRIDGVSVKLEDVNGVRKGENDKRVLITVRIKKEEPVIIDESNGDMYNAITKAAHRLQNVLAKKHEKRLEKLHGH